MNWTCNDVTLQSLEITLFDRKKDYPFKSMDKYNQCELFVALQLYSDSLKHKYNYCVICLGTIFIIANLLIGLAQLDDIVPMILVGRVMGGIGVGTYNYFYFMYV